MATSVRNQEPIPIGAFSELGSGLLSLIAHELRTPLAAASSSVELMAMRHHAWTGEKLASVLARVGSSLDRVDRILDDVSLVEHIASGRAEPEIREVELSTFVRQCTAGNDISISENDVECTIRISPTLLERSIFYALQFFLPETSGTSSATVAALPPENRPRFVITFRSTLDSPEAAARLCDHEVQRRSFQLRIAQLAAALHRWTVSVERVSAMDAAISLRGGAADG